MLETTVSIPRQLEDLSDSLKALSEKASFERAQAVINNVISLLGIDQSGSWKPFNDSQGKIRSNAGWFMVAEGFADKRAAYKIADINSQNIDLKCFWMKKLNKSVISWLVALTPNFEDEPFYGNLNLGIDFVIPEEANRVLVVLSKNYVIRTVELQDSLSVTQQDIFNAWLTGFDYSNKAQVHETLWKSFDLEPVNKSFYKGISAYFVELKQFLSEDTKVFNDKHAAYFTNRLIGRIVFCWFLNKKGIINPEMQYFQVGDMAADQYYHQKLETLFFKVFNTPLEERESKSDQKTPFLNGGLFEIKSNDKFGDPNLAFPKDYFDRLYAFLRHYNFTTDESTASFQQVAIDPEMLGRIFENLLAEQIEETGEQARKAKGAFYTPREIVDYMCRESLREYLKTKIPEDDLRDQRIGLLLDVKPHEFRDQQRNYRSDLKPYKYELLKALDEIKIIDPACGSGAFPVGMLHLLLEIYDRLDATYDPYKKKIEVIKNNLFGVDIEPMAVEICRLRAWLSIIVDEESDSKKIEPLPNLDFKFICANSLIPLIKENGGELFDTINHNELIVIRDKYFNARTKKSKEDWHKKYEKIIGYKKTGNMFHSDREKQLRSYHPFDIENVSQFFDADFMFGIKDGFDVVIGNPPYVFTRNMKFTDKFKEEIKQNYFKHLNSGSKKKGNRANQSGKINYFLLFIMRGLMLSKDERVVSYIMPNTILRTTTYDLYRRYILDESEILQIIDLGGGVFDGVTAATDILIFKKNNDVNKKHTVKTISNIKNFETHDWNTNLIPQLNFYLNVSYAFNIFVDANCGKLLKRIEKNKSYLGEICTDIIEGIVAHKHLITEEGLDSTYPLMEGKSIKRYYIEKLRKNIIWNKKKIHRTRPDYLWELDKKIVIQRISGGKKPIVAAVDTNRLRTFASVNNLVLKDEYLEYYEYVVALLNSSVLNYYYAHNFSNKSDLTVNISKTFLEKLPIVIPTRDNFLVKNIQNLVKKIQKISGNATNPQRILLENQIDELIFDLYELTPEERKIVMDGV